MATPSRTTAAVWVSNQLHVKIHAKAPTEEITQLVIVMDYKTEAFLQAARDMAERSLLMT